MTMLKARTAAGEVSSGRNALPNSAQAEQASTPSSKQSATWMTIFQGKLAIAAYAVVLAITITQPLTLIHWNIAAPQTVIGPRRLSCADPGPDIAIAAAR